MNGTPDRVPRQTDGVDIGTPDFRATQRDLWPQPSLCASGERFAFRVRRFGFSVLLLCSRTRNDKRETTNACFRSSVMKTVLNCNVRSRLVSRLLTLALTFNVLSHIPHAVADEGMWPFDNPPRKEWKKRYDFDPSDAWLEHLRLASVRVESASASFVSPNGLVMTLTAMSRSCQTDMPISTTSKAAAQLRLTAQRSSKL